MLPFDNLSRDRENAYLADGIQEGILGLAQERSGDLAGSDATYLKGGEKVSG